MRDFVRSGLVATFVVGFATVAPAQALKTGQPDSKSATRAAVPPRPAILDEVVATVNGEPIIRDDLYRFLQNTGTPPGTSVEEDQDIYKATVEQFVNRKLLSQYLRKQPALAVSEKEVDAEFAAAADQYKKAGEDFNIALASQGITVASVRQDMKEIIRNRKYIEAVANDANLKKFVADNKDLFNRNQVRTSHILIRVEPNATPADKAKAKAKLLAIKQEVLSGKISFADAANKYTEDEGNKAEMPAESADKAKTVPVARGGDIGFRERKGIVEPYAAAAFATKVGAISDPVETGFGYHLIQVTDRKDGTPIDFEQNKLYIRSEYAADLHERIIKMEQKTAKIKIEPMPADFFPKVELPATVTGTPPADATKTATPGKAAAPR